MQILFDEDAAVYLYMSYTKSKIYHDVSSNRIMIGERELNTSDLANIQSLYKSRTGVRLTIKDIKHEVNKIADENQVSLANTRGSPKRINDKPVRDALFKVTRQAHDDNDMIFMSVTLSALSRELGCDVNELKEHINVIRAHLINLLRRIQTRRYAERLRKFATRSRTRKRPVTRRTQTSAKRG